MNVFPVTMSLLFVIVKEVVDGIIDNLGYVYLSSASIPIKPSDIECEYSFEYPKGLSQVHVIVIPAV